MINKIGIPINIHESKAFIQSSNNENKETLNLENFIKLIFSDNQIDYLIRMESSNDVKEGLKTESNEDKSIKKYSNKQDEVENLKAFIRTRIPLLVKNFTNMKVKDALCDLPSFSNVIKSLRISGNFSNPEIIVQLFNEYKNKDDLVDYKKFVDSISVRKEKNFFFAFQDKSLTSKTVSNSIVMMTSMSEILNQVRNSSCIYGIIVKIIQLNVMILSNLSSRLIYLKVKYPYFRPVQTKR